MEDWKRDDHQGLVLCPSCGAWISKSGHRLSQDSEDCPECSTSWVREHLLRHFS